MFWRPAVLRCPAGVVDAGEPEPGPRILGRFTLSDMHYAVNVVYWSLLLVSVLTGNELISRLVHFEVYSTLMFAASALFTLYHSVRFATDLRRHMKVRWEVRCSQPAATTS
jgi:hypothetical protein